MAMAAAVASGPAGRAEAGGGRPALRAWRAELERERKRMGIPTQEGLAQWAGFDPGDLSNWRSGSEPVPLRQGRRLVALFDHNPRWEGLWLRLAQEQEQVALRRDQGSRLRLVGRRRPPRPRPERLASAGVSCGPGE